MWWEAQEGKLMPESVLLSVALLAPGKAETCFCWALWRRWREQGQTSSLSNASTGLENRSVLPGGRALSVSLVMVWRRAGRPTPQSRRGCGALPAPPAEGAANAVGMVVRQVAGEVWEIILQSVLFI